MAIEQTRAGDGVSLVQPPAKPRAGTQAPAQNGGAADSFQTLLGDSLEDAAPELPADGSVADDTSDPASDKAKNDPMQAAAQPDAPPPPADASQAAVPPADAGAAAAQPAQQAAASQADAQAATLADIDAVDGVNGRGARGVDLAAAQTPADPASVAGGARPVATVPARAPDAAATAAQAEARAGMRDGARVTTAPVPARQARPAAGAQATASAAQPATQEIPQQAQAPRAAANAQLAGQDSQALAQAAVSTATATVDFSAFRRGERRSEGPGTGGAANPAAATTDATLGRHALTADAAMPVATSGIDTGGAGMEDRMAAQVSYWLSQKTQNAELSLELQDGRPVEVSISMTGNEAHVAFRAAHGATREMLGSALPQLRELLNSEGVVLSGVTVDAFGAQSQRAPGDDAQGGERRGRGGRAVVSVADAAAPARASSFGGGSAGRSLDLYV